MTEISGHKSAVVIPLEGKLIARNAFDMDNKLHTFISGVELLTAMMCACHRYVFNVL